jgi:uncharacterized protein
MLSAVADTESFANDPQRASEAGKKGGRHSHRGAAEANQSGSGRSQQGAVKGNNADDESGRGSDT